MIPRCWCRPLFLTPGKSWSGYNHSEQSTDRDQRKEKGFLHGLCFTEYPRRQHAATLIRLRFIVGQSTLPPDADAVATSPVKNPRLIVFEPSRWGWIDSDPSPRSIWSCFIKVNGFFGVDHAPELTVESASVLAREKFAWNDLRTSKSRQPLLRTGSSSSFIYTSA